jgi:hypothetical protein
VLELPLADLIAIWDILTVLRVRTLLSLKTVFLLRYKGKLNRVKIRFHLHALNHFEQVE